jgi:hypothetical protein
MIDREIIEAFHQSVVTRAEDIVTRVHDDAHEPAFEAASVKLLEGAESLDKAVLHRVCGSGFILQCAIGQAVGQPLVLFDQRLERAGLALTGARDQFLLIKVVQKSTPC